MNPFIEMFITIVSAVLASSGLWAYIQKRRETKDDKTKLLVGLAHDRIIFLGMRYVDREFITQDEYENLVDYLYEPYHALGGNGSAERVINEVKKLPIRSASFIEKAVAAVEEEEG